MAFRLARGRRYAGGDGLPAHELPPVGQGGGRACVGLMERFEVHPTKLSGALILERKPIADVRGYLERLYCDSEFGEILGRRPIRQVNRTLTRVTGTVRGMHFQRAPHAEVKLIQCLRGVVFDVAVALEAASA